MSANLGLTQLNGSDTSKATKINTIVNQVDGAIAHSNTILVDNTNARTLTNSELRGASIFFINNDSPAPTGAITLTLPALRRGLIFILNNTSFTITVTISGQPLTAPTVTSAKRRTFVSDGVNVMGAALEQS